MEIKKSKKAAMERFRTTWLLMGFVATLAFVFMAFEWSQYDMVVDTSLALRDVEFEEEIELLRMYDQPAPPPEPEPVTYTEVLAIVENTADVPEGTVESSEETDRGVEFRYLPPVVEEPEVIEDIIHVSVEQMPEFPGGQAALFQFLNKHMKYPQVCQESDIQGRVIVQFVVDKDGSITNPEVVRSVHPLLDTEALRVIRMMPKWKQGMQQFTPVRVKYTVPVIFRLQ